MNKAEKSLKKYNDYISSPGDKKLTECMYYLHDAYDGMSAEDKENAYLYTLVNFPETIAYAMLKLSSIKIDVAERFREEYKESYKNWLEDIETDLVVGFGDVKIFLTYAKLYIYGMNAHVDTLKKLIEKKFSEQKEERDRQEWIHKKIY